MGAPRTTPKVLEAFTANRGRELSMAQMRRITGLDPEQIRPSVRALISQGLPIEVLVIGQMWRMAAEDGSSNPAPAKPGKPPVVAEKDGLFEVVGTSAKGDVIVRGDVTSQLFKIVPF